MLLRREREGINFDCDIGEPNPVKEVYYIVR